MKKISKEFLDTLILNKRKYWAEAEQSYLDGAIAIAREIFRTDGVEWISIYQFVGSIVMHGGLCEDASNEKIYEVLKLLGWEIADEVEESESL